MPDFEAVVFVEGQLPFNVANAFDAVNSAFDGQCWVMFLHNVLGRKIYPTLLRPRTFIHNSFPMISSRPEGLPKSPRPRLFKPEWASNILRQSFDFRKKTLLHIVGRAHSSCAPNNVPFSAVRRSPTYQDTTEQGVFSTVLSTMSSLELSLTGYNSLTLPVTISL